MTTCCAGVGRSVPPHTRNPPRSLCGLAALAFLLTGGCQPESPMPPIPAPVVNTGDPDLETIELSISDPDRNPAVIRRQPGARFNVSWLGPIQNEPPAEPHVFLAKIGSKHHNGQLMASQSFLVLETIGIEGDQARYRVAMAAPDEPGTYALQLWTPGTVIVDVELLVE